jgi:Rha family phage regulatory protein
MNQIITTPVVCVRDGKVFANSRDVATFFEKRHDHVLRDIDNLLKDMTTPNLGASLFSESTYQGGNGEARRCLEMTRDGFSLLAMGFTGPKALAFKLRDIEQFNAMEAHLRAAPAQIDLSNPDHLLPLLSQYAEDKKRLQARIEADQPKTAFYDRFATADGLYGLQNAARVLGIGPNKFISLLKQGYLFYQGTALVPKAQYRDMGIFEVKATVVDEKARHQTYVTPKGIQYLARKLGVDQLPLGNA